jgi:hypothetical protein
MNDLADKIVGVLVAVIGLATIAVIVGSKNTAGVLQAGGQAFGTIIGAAVAPASGGSSLGSLGSNSIGSGLLGGL